MQAKDDISLVQYHRLKYPSNDRDRRQNVNVEITQSGICISKSSHTQHEQFD